MPTFAQAINTPSLTETTNGMVALEHTGSDLVNLFFNAGSSRNDQDSIKTTFARAFAENKLLATKILFWLRDARDGAGERETFRNLLNEVCQYAPEVAIKNIRLVPKFGRWDDLLAIRHPEVRKAAFNLIAASLRNQTDGWQLCSKWMPRKGADAVALRNWMNLSPKAYRKMLVNGTQVVETAMCSGDWTKINYEHVPSVAAKQYQKAFGRHDPMGYSTYKTKLVKGEATINASAIFPHDVIQGLRYGDATVAQAQWDSLPNYLGDDYILPVVDVSGSMSCKAGTSNVSCLDVAVALGLYVANKQQGAFHKVFCTFSHRPQLITLKSDHLSLQFSEMSNADWGMNTNVEAVFKLVLAKAVENEVPQSQMPKMILIMSDMQFDQCVTTPNQTAMQMIRSRFEAAGYETPKVVFWNLNAQYGNAPVTFNESGTALISGFNTAILKPLLSCKGFTPWEVMMETIGERYNEVQV